MVITGHRDMRNHDHLIGEGFKGTSGPFAEVMTSSMHVGEP